MKFYVPVYVLIEVSSPVDAIRAKQSMEKLLQSGVVSMAIQANVPHVSIQVGEPVPAQVTPQGNYRNG